MQQYKNTVTTALGLPIEGATVTVTLAAGGAASLYSGNNTGALGSNVLTTGADGGYVFYAANGRYLLTIAASGFAGNTLDVVLYDPVDLIPGADYTGVSDITSALQAYVTAYGGKLCEIPECTLRVTNAITVPANTWIRGRGRGSRIITTTLANGGADRGHRVFDVRSVAGVRITDLAVEAGGLTGLAAGMRALLFFNATDYEVRRLYITTPGAAVASVGCSNYKVVDNDILVQSTTGTAAHDGIIDNWQGNADFTIDDNRIDAAGIGLWPILVTALNTDLVTPEEAASGSIRNNKVKNCLQLGIYVQGRSGDAHDIVVDNNLVDTTGSYGIGLSDCYGYVCTNNIVRSAAKSGIRAYNESPTWGSAAAKKGVIAGNLIIDANTSGDTSIDPGSAISVTDASQHVLIGPNTVVGSTHRYAVHVGADSTDVEVLPGAYQPGVVGTIINGATASTTISVPGGGTYTPTLTSGTNVASTANPYARYERRGNIVTLNGRLEVTPTATAGANTEVGISLPYASGFTVAQDASGTAATGYGTVGAIFADATNDRLTLRFPADDSGSNVFFWTASYAIK